MNAPQQQQPAPASRATATTMTTTTTTQQRAELSNLLWLLGRRNEWNNLRKKLCRPDCVLKQHQQQAMVFLTFAINSKAPDDIIELILKCNPDVFCNSSNNNRKSSPSMNAAPLPFQVAILRGSSTNTRIVLEAARQQSLLRQHSRNTSTL